jgi:hypothetical protein
MIQSLANHVRGLSSGPIQSTADIVGDLLALEQLLFGTFRRPIDYDATASMEQKKPEGYF